MKFFFCKAPCKVDLTSIMSKKQTTKVSARSLKEFETSSGHFEHSYEDPVLEYPTWQSIHRVP